MEEETHVDDLEGRVVQWIYGGVPPSGSLLGAPSTSDMGTSDWWRVALSDRHDPRDRCYAAWKLGDWSLWEQLHHDPALTDWKELTGHFFPSRSVSSSLPVEIPAVSRDDYGVELLRLLRQLVRESGTGRFYWRDLKQRFPQLEHRAEVISLFAGRVFVTGEDLEPHRAPARRGRYQVSAATHEQMCLLMLNTSPRMNRRIVEDPHLVHFGRWHGFVTVATRGHPMPGNNIAWVAINPNWRRGAWLIEEIVSYIVQGCGTRSLLLKKLEAFPEIGAQELIGFRASILREFADWSDSAMCTTLHAARENGVDDLYLYTPRHIRASSSDISDSLVTALYRDLPLRYGFERREVGDADEVSKIFWHRKVG